MKGVASLGAILFTSLVARVLIIVFVFYIIDLLRNASTEKKRYLGQDHPINRSNKRERERERESKISGLCYKLPF